MSECQNCTVPHEKYTITVRYPFRTRVAETWNSYLDTLIIILWLAGYIFILGLVLSVTFVVLDCHKAPRLALQSLGVRDMVVYQNGTNPGWHVDSAFDVTMGTKNPNTVEGCYTTLRRVVVRVEYKGQTIVDQDVPLGFGLRPRRSRPVTMALQGQQFPLKNPDLGPYLRAEMERGNVTMDIYLYARYLRNDRRAQWKGHGCLVVASAPNSSNSSSSRLLFKDCYPI